MLTKDTFLLFKVRGQEVFIAQGAPLGGNPSRLSFAFPDEFYPLVEDLLAIEIESWGIGEVIRML